MEKASNQFSIREARGLVKDLSVPNPSIYWGDFLASILIGHVSLFLLTRLDRLGITALQTPVVYWASCSLLFTTTAILYMRSVMFIHELVHLPEEGFRAFRVAWNLLCGIPLLVPSFLYYPHIDHHRRKHYGTDLDGEYLDLSHRHPANMFLFVAAAAAVPLAAFARFLVMTPIAWVVPGFRAWVEKHASSMIIDIFYLRGDFGAKARQIMRLQEVLCFVWCAGLVAAWYFGRVSNLAVGYSYALATTLIVINNVRTLGAHRWVGDGRELTFEEQLLDSVNYPHRAWITELWGPVGTRYHAIHHLFPSMPYHNLGIAHRRLMEGLPKDSIYRQTERTSLMGAIFELWQRARHRNDANSNAIELDSIRATNSRTAA
ncbi:MAG: fatty acid desaturase [Pirellulales bacterium]